MIRDLTIEERSWLSAGRWPCCGTTEFMSGPRAGIMLNVACPQCGTKLNIVDPSMGLGHGPAQMLEEPCGYKNPGYCGTPPRVPFQVKIDKALRRINWGTTVSWLSLALSLFACYMAWYTQ